MIRKIKVTDYPRLIEIWESAVLSTHDFLKEEDFLYYKEQLPVYFQYVTLFGFEQDTIYGVDFAERIADALARTDYREAVRLLYLQTLKQLSDGKRIDWQLYKTPTQYIYEVRLPAFRQMTNHFLRVRYGNFEATETLFHAMRDLQKEVEKGGAA